MYDGADGTYFGDFEEIQVLELKKLPEVSDGTEIWNWGRFIGAEREEDIRMTALKNPAIEKAAEALRLASGDEAVRHQYELRRKMLMDDEARRVFAETTGMERGMKQGMEKGMEKGIQIGEQRGQEAVLKLLRNGKSAEEVLREFQK